MRISILFLIIFLPLINNAQGVIVGPGYTVGTTYFQKQTERSIARTYISPSYQRKLCFTDWPFLGTSNEKIVRVITDSSNNWSSVFLTPHQCESPNLATSNGMDYLMATTPDSGMILYTSPSGTNQWTEYFPLNSFNLYQGQNDQWSRMIVGGINQQTIHVIVNSQGYSTTPVLGQNGPLTYSRSEDGGLTWNIDHVQLPGSDSTFFLGFNRGNYAIDARGDVVAIVAGGFDADLCLWKSTDNGTTWTKSIIFDFPLNLYDDTQSILDINSDGIPDTIETAGQDPSVVIDKFDKIHVSFGRMLIFDTLLSSKAGYDPYADGLFYWNELMTTPSVVANANDKNFNGYIDIPVPIAPNDLGVGAYFGGLLTQSCISTDLDGRIYITYASVNEEADTLIFQCAHRHVHVTFSSNNGLGFTLPESLIALSWQGGDGEYEETIFASSLREQPGGPNHIIEFMYLSDNAPYYFDSLYIGAPFYVQQSWNADVNGIPFMSNVMINVTFLTDGISDNQKPLFSLYPQPSYDRVYLNGEFKSDFIQIFSLQGHLLKVVKLSNNSFSVNDIPDGLYICRLTQGNDSYNSKLIVCH